MVDIYRASCDNCHSFYELKYGRINNNEVYEILSCPDCKNLFSVSNNKRNIACPTCGNDKLIPYNMNKEKNIRYYQKMMNKRLLPPQEYNSLIKYWNNVESTLCPKCDHQALHWRLYEKR